MYSVSRPLGHLFLLAFLPVAMLLLAPSLVLWASGRTLSPEVQALLPLVGAQPVLTPLLMRIAGREWDPNLIGPVWVLCALGLAVVARVQPDLLAAQLLWISAGWAAFITLVAFTPLLLWFERFRDVLFAGGIALVVATFVFGDDVSGQGARLWLSFGPVTVQPAEVLRILLIIFIAGHLLRLSHQRETGAAHLSWLSRDSLPLMAALAVSLALVLAQRDFGPAVIFGAAFVAMLYLATGRTRYIGVAGGLAAVAFVLIYLGSDRIAERVDVWIDPWSDPTGSGYQSLQAMGAFVFGGIFGTGPGYGYPGLIPAAHTDYPLAVIGEEWGLLGSLAIVALYGLLLTRALRSGVRGGNGYAQLLAAGLAVSLAGQVLLVFGGVVRLLPLTGLTSPFLSYGGSSMVMSWVLLALLVRGSGDPQRPGLPRLPDIEIPSRQVGLVVLAGLSAVALALGYWQVGRTDLLEDYAVTGKRLLGEEERVQRGRILDREGRVLAATSIGPDGQPYREYTAPGAVHLLGFISSRAGAAGIESVAADRLLGRTASTPQDTLRDLLHQARTGNDVQLTIDLELQRVAAEALGDSPGALVALDPRSGDILAMVSSPGFNPNFTPEEWDHLREAPDSPLLNRATQGLYTPGSTFKTVTLAAALEFGLVTPTTAVSCVPEVFIDGVRIVSQNEPPGRTTQSVADAYAFSCNTYFAELGVQLGAERLRTMAEALGLTSEVPFALPTSRGRLSTSSRFFETTAGLAASAFGQGELQLSPLHLALTAAAIANGGEVPLPRIFFDDDPATWHRAMSHGTAQAMAEMMEYGVEAGWASTVALSGFRLGGKTGSAEVSPDESPHALFIAYGPTDDPQIAIAVVKEHGGSGSQQAGPIARAVIAAWLSR